MPQETSTKGAAKAASTPTYDPAKQYRIRIGRPIVIDADLTLLPSHDEIIVSGSLLEQIQAQVLEAHECV